MKAARLMMRALSAVRRLESTDQHQGRGRGCASTRRQSLMGVLAGSLLLVALVPFLPLAMLTWSGYHREVKRLEEEIRAAARVAPVTRPSRMASLVRSAAKRAKRCTSRTRTSPAWGSQCRPCARPVESTGHVEPPTHSRHTKDS